MSGKECLKALTDMTAFQHCLIQQDVSLIRCRCTTPASKFLCVPCGSLKSPAA